MKIGTGPIAAILYEGMAGKTLPRGMAPGPCICNPQQRGQIGIGAGGGASRIAVGIAAGRQTKDQKRDKETIEGHGRSLSMRNGHGQRTDRPGQ